MKLKIPSNSRVSAQFPGGWTLYRLLADGSSSFLWQGFKLMLPPDTPGNWGRRRAFVLFWSPTEQRLRKDGERAALEAQEGALHDMVVLHLELDYGPAWLSSEDGGGYTAEEIQAERARLDEVRAERKAARARRPRL